jgi:hypothetical protein
MRALILTLILSRALLLLLLPLRPRSPSLELPPRPHLIVLEEGRRAVQRLLHVRRGMWRIGEETERLRRVELGLGMVWICVVSLTPSIPAPLWPWTLIPASTSTRHERLDEGLLLPFPPQSIREIEFHWFVDPHISLTDRAAISSSEFSFLPPLLGDPN